MLILGGQSRPQPEGGGVPMLHNVWGSFIFPMVYQCKYYSYTYQYMEILYAYMWSIEC